MDWRTTYDSIVDRSQTRVMGGVILVALRSMSADHGEATAQLAAQYLDQGVLGMDVAGDEGNYPLSSDNAPMVAGVREAARLGVPLTVHAGEWPEQWGSLANLEWAVASGLVTRVGHGIVTRSASDKLIQEIISRNITVEVCLTSNIGNGFKVANYSVHPVKLLHDRGVPFSLSSDNLLLSGDHSHAPSPTAEVLHLVHDVGLGWEAAKQSVIHGLRASFSPSVTPEFIESVKSQLDAL